MKTNFLFSQISQSLFFFLLNGGSVGEGASCAALVMLLMLWRRCSTRLLSVTNPLDGKK